MEEEEEEENTRSKHQDWTLLSGRGVSGIGRDIAFEVASAQGDVSWVTLGIA